MSLAKPLTLSLACALILATYAAPTFAEVSLSYSSIEYSYSQQSAGDDGESLWDYICGWLF
jgi:hypothetical protein